jgi:hypothetical protein
MPLSNACGPVIFVVGPILAYVQFCRCVLCIVSVRRYKTKNRMERNKPPIQNQWQEQGSVCNGSFQSTWMPDRSVPRRSAPFKSARYTSAPAKIAPLKSQCLQVRDKRHRQINRQGQRKDLEKSMCVCIIERFSPRRGSSTCLKLEPFRLALVKSASWNWHPSKSQFSSDADTSDAPWKVAPTTYESILQAKQNERVNSP